MKPRSLDVWRTTKSKLKFALSFEFHETIFDNFLSKFKLDKTLDLTYNSSKNQFRGMKYQFFKN